ncbi:MAG: 23S rRNA (uracil-5-)-methyltransferase RumA, partial [Oscillospiraceae bacterium]|nr:23S rRNA (uracil-5-)-methyltransferase RumA [Oscillospiraceae bacterium]
LARDLKILCAEGYRLERVQPVDQFPGSVHVECVTLLQRMSNTRERTITLDVEMEDYHRIKNEGR